MERAVGTWQVVDNMIYILGGLSLSSVIVIMRAQAIKSNTDEHDGCFSEIRITATEIGDGVQRRKEVAIPLLNKCERNS